MQQIERARWAIAVIFALNGAVIGGWASVIPETEARLGLAHGTFGMALLASAAGAIVAMPIAGWLISHFGSRRVTLMTGVADILFVLGMVFAPNLPSLIVALFAFGAANGAMDVAMNAHGVGVEMKLRRPIMSSLHGIFSLGGLLGGGLAIVLLPLAGVPVYMLSLSACLMVTLALVGNWLLPGSLDAQSGGSPFVLPRGPAVGLGLLAFLALMSEGAIIDWGAIYLRGELAASEASAAAGFAIFSGSMAASRLTGDRLRMRFGTVRLVRASAILTSLGVGAALIAPTLWLAWLGLALAGLGIGNVIPALFGAAGRMPGQAPGVSIATCTTLGYAGFLLGPPLIGRIADWSRLGVGLSVLVVAMVLVAVAASATRHADGDDRPT